MAAKELVDMRDARFVLFEQLHVDEHLSPELKESYDIDTLKMVLTEAEKLALTALAPTNKDGEKIGCHIKDGKVTIPDSFKKAYALICEGGWNIVADAIEVGGQGLPKTIETCCHELIEAANISFSNLVNLTHGAAKLVEIFGTPEQKETYLGKMYGGQWTGTMCLTESDAGSDLAAVKTLATRKPDGTFSIHGTKTFITNGDHDMSENNIHMVLARIEGDPAGTRGLSLFIVPKYRVEGGKIGAYNDVACTGIEEKMGLHGSPTCTLNFGDNDDCVGFLIGKEKQGIMVMFHMMNEARQAVGRQGLAVGSAAYLKALAYTKERLQGVHYTKTRDPEASRVPIIEHPDIRVMLMKMKAYVEGCRGLVYYHAHCMDRAEQATSDAERDRWQGMVELLTPVCKAYSTDRGFDVCNLAVQSLGGYGFCSEYPVEQNLRDVKITAIYEGTNSIQAMDLTTRKISMKKGALLAAFMEEIDRVMDLAKEDAGISAYVARMAACKKMLEEGARLMTEEMQTAQGIALSKSTAFLEFFGDIALGWQWLWHLAIARKELAAQGKNLEALEQSPDNAEAAYYIGKVQTAKFYLDRILPGVSGKLECLKTKNEDFLGMGQDCF
jgi:alkylation response protein AidB-like acyl-CoA dehydrogenase